MSKPTLLNVETASMVATLQRAVTHLRQEDIEGIAAQVHKSPEHSLPLAQYTWKALPDDAQKVFQDYGGSAFDEGCVQDLKHHLNAVEVYFMLKGDISVLVKNKGPERFHPANVLKISAVSTPWAIIPAGYCLLVANPGETCFLCIALKSEKSIIDEGEGGKKLGKFCPHYHEETQALVCPYRGSCETPRQNRDTFFTGKVSRAHATRCANTTARLLI